MNHIVLFRCNIVVYQCFIFLCTYNAHCAQNHRFWKEDVTKRFSYIKRRKTFDSYILEFFKYVQKENNYNTKTRAKT